MSAIVIHDEGDDTLRFLRYLSAFDNGYEAGDFHTTKESLKRIHSEIVANGWAEKVAGQVKITPEGMLRAHQAIKDSYVRPYSPKSRWE